VPDLQSESGRYLTAHHAMLIADATRNPSEPAHALSSATAESWTAHMSLFQSLPDAWALGMVFPTLPLEGIHDPLAERPAVLSDTTCDSDGRLKRYVTGYGLMGGMPMPVTDDGHRRLAFCLTGAYQEVLANAHNLLGRPAEVTVGRQDGRMHVQIDRPAQSVASILKDFGYDATEAAADSVSTYATVDRPSP
jgi:arginine decarboxylase